MEYEAPAQVQSLGWEIFFTGLFVLGIVAGLVTAHKTLKGYRESGDSWSTKTMMHGAVGGTITALMLFPGLFLGVIKLMGSVFSSFGVGS